MSKQIKFEIVTPEKSVLKTEIIQATVPTESGEITILKNHIPLVSVLTPGVIETVNEKGEKEIMSVSGGFVQVQKEKIVILADEAERAEELDETKIEEARKKAEEAKKELRSFDKERFATINATIATELAKSRAVRRWKKIKNINN